MTGFVTDVVQFQHYQTYLKDRGLDDITIERLDLRMVGASALHEINISQAGLVGGILWTLRYLDGRPTGEYGARCFYSNEVIAGKAPAKFVTPKGQSGMLYYSPLANWSNIPKRSRIILCESYLKADIAALCGYYAIGMSGVWGWSKGQKVLSTRFAELPWKALELEPVISFDSNVCEEREDLMMAAQYLTTQLEIKHGVTPSLPAEDYKSNDWGLDDYYASHGIQATQDYLSSVPQHIITTRNTHLNALNEEVVYVREVAKVVELETGVQMSPGIFKEATYVNRVRWDEEGVPRKIAKEWMEWTERNDVSEIVYHPGDARVKIPDWFNAWDGMGVDPIEGDVTLFLDWLNDAFVGDVEKHFFLNWWSYQLQNPGAKMSTALVMVGPSGTGKGWVSEIMSHIFGGRNVAKVDLSVFEERFNGDYAQRQLVTVEEASQLNTAASSKVYNKVKDLITNPEIRMEAKGMDAKMVRNVGNLFLSANKLGIFKIDEYDRRLAILEMTGNHASVGEYWTARFDWIQDQGAAAIYHYLLNYDCSNFSPKADAPMTQAKQDMVDMTADPIDSWCRGLISNPEQLLSDSSLKDIDGRLFTPTELAYIFNDGRTPLSELTGNSGKVRAMATALREHKVPMANSGKRLKCDDYQATSYFCLTGDPSTPRGGSWKREIDSRQFFKLVKESEGKNPQSKY